MTRIYIKINAASEVGNPDFYHFFFFLRHKVKMKPVKQPENETRLNKSFVIQAFIAGSLITGSWQ